MSAAPALDRLVGRDDEFAALGRLVTEGGTSFRALVMEGEPGTGKTTRCRVGAELARGQGLTVVSCNPVEAGTMLAFAPLGDLLAPLADDLCRGVACAATTIARGGFVARPCGQRASGGRQSFGHGAPNKRRETPAPGRC
ncbi:MAG TPA: hypothetical protein VN786_03160 [Acidimicrobiales bacterium]|nr:hypothetical protein [Acidimicrobiales bacterium]